MRFKEGREELEVGLAVGVERTKRKDKREYGSPLFCTCGACRRFVLFSSTSVSQYQFF